MSNFPFNYIDYQVDRTAKIATVTLTNPARANAAPDFAEAQLTEAIDKWESDDDVKVVVIRGAGDHFCGGHDVGTYLDTFKVSQKPAEKRRPNLRESIVVQRNMRAATRRLFFSLKPTIAMIQGQCIELGNIFQVCCDISIAAHDAHIGNLGQTAGTSGITLIRLYAMLIGYKRTREMMISGRTWSGREASKIGLINRSVPKEKLEAEVMNEAGRIAILPIDGIVTGKAYTHMVFESMGLGQAFTENYYGHMLGLKLRFEPDEFWFFDEIRKHGTKHAVRARQERYQPYGGFGEQNEKPIVIE